MAKVEIYLEEGETQEEAKEVLLKALVQQESGEDHREDFQQPAARDVMQFMNREHEAMWEQMLREIFAVIDQEV